MNNRLFPLIFCIALVVGFWTTSFANPDPRLNGTRISYADFQEKMAHYIDLMREEAEFSVDEYIEMVMIDNTYFLFMRNSNPKYKVNQHNEFLDFFKQYSADIRKTLDANDQGCNGGFYSSKYDLCIGGAEPNAKSVYEVY